MDKDQHVPRMPKFRLDILLNTQYINILKFQFWEVVQRQDMRLWTVESGFESLLPSPY
jgi:hypothetical protein